MEFCIFGSRRKPFNKKPYKNMIQTKFNCTSEVFELKTKLQNNGIIFFEKIINEEEFCNFCENFGNIYYHRDSNQNGITIVKKLFRK